MARGGKDAAPAPAAVVERQMRNWELARRQRHPEGRRDARKVQDFICVSRMVGVGDEVTRLLGERLSWPVFDKQILDAMAGDDRRMRQIYAEMDERKPGWWEEVLNPLIREGLTRNDYFQQLVKTVVSLARQSPGVFVGRGLDRVLPADQGFRVQLVAPLEARVARHAERCGVDETTARREIERTEEERSAFLRRHFGVAPTDPLRYDLTVRVDRLRPQDAVELILGAREHSGAVRWQ